MSRHVTDCPTVNNFVIWGRGKEELTPLKIAHCNTPTGSLDSQTIYLPARERKRSSNRAYVSFPSPRIVGNNTLPMYVLLGVSFVYIRSSLYFAHAWLLTLLPFGKEQGVKIVALAFQ